MLFAKDDARRTIPICVEKPGQSLTIDLGSLRAGSSIGMDLELTNASRSDVELHAVAASCGCTLVELPERGIVKPNSIRKCSVQLEVPLKFGKIAKAIDFVDAGQRVVCTVVLSGKVVGDFEIESDRILFDETRGGMLKITPRTESFDSNEISVSFPVSHGIEVLEKFVADESVTFTLDCKRLFDDTLSPTLSSRLSIRSSGEADEKIGVEEYVVELVAQGRLDLKPSVAFPEIRQIDSGKTLHFKLLVQTPVAVKDPELFLYVSGKTGRPAKVAQLTESTMLVLFDLPESFFDSCQAACQAKLELSAGDLVLNSPFKVMLPKLD